MYGMAQQSMNINNCKHVTISVKQSRKWKRSFLQNVNR